MFLSILLMNGALMYAISHVPLPIPAPLSDCDNLNVLYIFSQAMQNVKSRIQKVSQVKHATLIIGETGVGKELCAREIHHHVDHQDRPFVAVNCAAIPKELLNTELFGCVPGAFTGSKIRPGLIRCAQGGTLFLDEIGELSLACQASLLRVLETGEVRAVGSEITKRVHFRLLSATHRDLPYMVSKGLFRADLYHRISTMNVYIPALRDRIQDIKGLITLFSTSVCERLTQGAWEIIYAYPWPGNVRELKNITFRLEVLVNHGRIFAHHIHEVLHPMPPKHNNVLQEDKLTEKKENEFITPHILLNTDLTLRQHINYYIREVLIQQKGNISNTAKALQIDRGTIYRHLKDLSQHRLSNNEFQKVGNQSPLNQFQSNHFDHSKSFNIHQDKLDIAS
jgi:transcriptional regulator with PAS, ATPase and Fis domain